MSETIEITHLSKNFGSFCAVNDITFHTQKGEIIALLGPNGAGKSTLMNMIAGYLSPTSGTIKILGKETSIDSVFAKTNIGFLPEGSPLYPDMTVVSFLQYMAELKGIKNIKLRLQEVAKISKIENVLHKKIETLSKGYRRRVGFAQSILSDPEILLLDEPTDGLDPNQKEHIRQEIKRQSTNKTIIISTHLLDEAHTLATRIIVIDHGQIKADGTLSEILKQTASSDIEQAFKKLTQAEKINA